MMLNRRQFAAAGACASLGVVGAARIQNGVLPRDRRKPLSRVAVIEADHYDDSLEERLFPFIQ